MHRDLRQSPVANRKLATLILVMVAWRAGLPDAFAAATRAQGRRAVALLGLLPQLPQAAMAQEDAPVRKGGRASKWYGTYEDPKHPTCERSIVITFDGTKGKIDGYDKSGAGDEGKFDCRKRRDVTYYDWSLKVSLDNKDADEIVVQSVGRDVVSRARIDGAKDVVGKWAGDGILWPDGTKWTQKRWER
mmetsp:Transcript_61980/g.115885  ORF Transcript_61980/g.115885 Transcript_61980/m.115885 type:complete len:189 (+) Transcript_61980:54-620(+)